VSAPLIEASIAISSLSSNPNPASRSLANLRPKTFRLSVMTPGFMNTELMTAYEAERASFLNPTFR
jgi:hypothetical protein